MSSFGWNSISVGSRSFARELLKLSASNSNSASGNVFQGGAVRSDGLVKAGQSSWQLLLSYSGNSAPSLGNRLVVSLLETWTNPSTYSLVRCETNRLNERGSQTSAGADGISYLQLSMCVRLRYLVRFAKSIKRNYTPTPWKLLKCGTEVLNY